MALGLEDRFCPDLRFDRISSVALEPLWERGIRGLALDLDNTLVPWRSMELGEDIRAWASRARAMGFALCIVSNTRRYRRLRQIADALDATYVTGAAKPRRGGFRAAAGVMGLSLDQMAVIGDQLLTDIFGGNRLGVMTILVDRLQSREFIVTQINRRIERRIAAALVRAGKMPVRQVAAEDDATA